MHFQDEPVIGKRILLIEPNASANASARGPVDDHRRRGRQRTPERADVGRIRSGRLRLVRIGSATDRCWCWHDRRPGPPRPPRSSAIRCGHSTPTCRCSGRARWTRPWRVGDGRNGYSARCSPSSRRSRCCWRPAVSTQSRRMRSHAERGRSACGWRSAPMLDVSVGRSWERQLRQLAIGLVLGTAGAAAVATVLPAILVGTGGANLLVFAGVAVVLVAAGVVASAVPARRAIRLDPVTALQAE